MVVALKSISRALILAAAAALCALSAAQALAVDVTSTSELVAAVGNPSVTDIVLSPAGRYSPTVTLAITRNMTIRGPANAPGATISGQQITTGSPDNPTVLNVVRVNQGVTLTLQDVAVIEGTTDPLVDTVGVLNLDGVTVATGSGSGVLVRATGTLNAVNATIADNAQSGIAVTSTGVVSLRHTTITNNSGNALQAVANSNLTIVNSIVSSLSNTADCSVVADSVTDSLGSDSPSTCGGGIASGAANLAPIQENGGPTPTARLNAGSPALNAGTVAANCTAQDQRNRTRSAAPCDIGAVERDLTPPTLATRANVSVPQAGVLTPVIFTSPVLTDSDGFPGGVTCSPESGSDFAVGATTVSCTGVNLDGLSSNTTTFTVTVTSGPPPTVTVPANQVVEATGPAGRVVTFAAATANNGGSTPLCTSAPTTGLASGSTFPLGVTTITCSSTNSNGTGTASFTVTVVDTTPPSVTVPANITQAATSPSGATVTFSTSASDTVAPASPAVTCAPLASGATFPVGTTTVTCSARDAANNLGSSSFTVTITAQTPVPVVTVPANQIVEATGPAGRVATFAAATASNGGSTPVCTSAPTTGLASGSTFPLGVTTITCSSTNGSGTGTASFTITVRDTTPPSVTVPVNITAAATSASGAAVTFASSATDLVAPLSPTVTCTPLASGATFPVGTTTVTCSARDTANNLGSSTFTVTVTPQAGVPVVTVPASQVVEATGPAGRVVTFAAATASNGGSTPVCTSAPTTGLASGSTFPLGVSTVTCSSTNGTGTGTASFTVTVRDTTAPVVTVPANITLQATGPNGAVATFTTSATDAVGPASPAVTCAPLASGATFPVGTTSVTCSARDTANNLGSATFSVTVNGQAGTPVVTVPASQVVEATGPSGAVVFFGGATASNGGSTPVCTSVPIAGLSGSTFPLGVTTITCRSSNSQGTGSASFTITVVDTTAPVVTVPADINWVSPPGPVTISWPTVKATDLVSGVLFAVCIPGSGTKFPAGITTVTCTATDGAGNVGSKSFKVTVPAPNQPVVTVPPNQVIEAAGPSGAQVSYAAPTASNGGNGPTCTSSPTAGLSSGSTFPIGVTTITCSSTNNTGTGTASFTVTVRDTTAPVVNVPGDLAVVATGPTGAEVTFAATATDNVALLSPVTCVPPSGSLFAVGATQVTCAAMDSSYNLGVSTFTVNVTPQNGSPVITVPPNRVVEATGPNGATATYAAPTASNGGSGPNCVSAPTAGLASGSTFPLGVTTITCSSTNTNGTGTASFKITVVDLTAPTVNPPADITLPATSAAGAVATWPAVSGADAVSGTLPAECTPPSGSTFPEGETTVTCSVSDAAFNLGSATFTVTVTPLSGLPVVGVPDSVSVEATGPSGRVVTFAAATTSNGGNGPSCTSAPTAGLSSGSTFPLGVTTITCTSTNGVGTGTASFTITVNDTTVPVVNVPDNITQASSTGESVAVTWPAVTATDVVSGTLAATCAPASGSSFAVGSTTVTCTATDAAGLAGFGTFTVTVTGPATGPPVITVPASKAVEATGPGGAAVTYAAPTTSNGGDGPTCTSAPATGLASGSTFPLGTTTITCTSTNSISTETASFAITVADTTAPVVSAPANISRTTAGAAVTVTWPVVTAADLVSGTLPATCTPPSGSSFAVGTTTVTCTATDAAGVSGSATFTVTVTKSGSAPIVTVPPSKVVEATGPTGAAVTYAAPTTTNGGSGPTCTSAPASGLASGSTFPLGTTTITCTSTNPSGTGTASFTVTVHDTIEPVVNVPSNITKPSAKKGSFVVVSWPDVTATDIVSGVLPATCNPPSGASFAVGATTVTCTATDTAGLTGPGTFTVTVTTSPKNPRPAVKVPQSRTVEATGPNGAVVTFADPTTNNGGNGPNCTSSPTAGLASGSTFPLGTTTIRCTSSNTSGTGRASFTMTVRDTTAPVVEVPGKIKLYSEKGKSLVVTWAEVSATDAVSGTLTATCKPASGSRFPVGKTTVVCQAKDAAGLTGRARFTVRIVGMKPPHSCDRDHGKDAKQAKKNKGKPSGPCEQKRDEKAEKTKTPKATK